MTNRATRRLIKFMRMMRSFHRKFVLSLAPNGIIYFDYKSPAAKLTAKKSKQYIDWRKSCNNRLAALLELADSLNKEERLIFDAKLRSYVQADNSLEEK